MNTSISRALALFVLSVPFCQADVLHYTVNFAPSADGVTPTGTFTYNTTTTLFETFNLTVLGSTFDYSAAANAPLLRSGSFSCLGELTGAPAFFAALRQPCPGGSWRLERLGSGGNFYVIFATEAVDIATLGSFSLSSSVSSRIVSDGVLTGIEQSPAVPEPTFALPLGLAIGALAWRRGRQK